MKKALKKLKRAYPNLRVHCFKGYGHGELTGHSEQLANSIKHMIEK